MAVLQQCCSLVNVYARATCPVQWVSRSSLDLTKLALSPEEIRRRPEQHAFSTMCRRRRRAGSWRRSIAIASLSWKMRQMLCIFGPNFAICDENFLVTLAAVFALLLGQSDLISGCFQSVKANEPTTEDRTGLERFQFELGQRALEPLIEQRYHTM